VLEVLEMLEDVEVVRVEVPLLLVEDVVEVSVAEVAVPVLEEVLV